MDMYDEFGNYIGPELDGSDSDVEDFGNGEEFDGNRMVVQEEFNKIEYNDDENRIILHEDKKYYPDAEEVYPGVKTVTLDEDAQELKEPIIKPVKQKIFSVLMKEPPKLRYENDFLVNLMNTPSLIRNVALVGHIHHGKTTFADTLVQATEEELWDPSKDVKYCDSRLDEQDRHLSIKSTLVSLVLDDVKEKSYLINLIDCPGHINFSDESIAAFRAVDGIVLVIDVIEGVMMHTERLIKQAVISQLPICVVSFSIVLLRQHSLTLKHYSC